MYKRTRTCVILAFMLIAGHSFAQDEDQGPLVTVGGANLLQFARGEKNIYDVNNQIPWNYLSDYLDFNLGLRHFFFNGRFQVDESSLNFNPYPAVFREFISRRTFGFVTKYVTVQAGHSKAIFGKGLTLNLQEDITVEKTNILDAIYASSTLTWLNAQFIVGRPLGNADTIRDNIIGFHGELYPLQFLQRFSLLSGISLGGGIVYFGKDVKQPRSDFQKRGVILLPQGQVYASIKNVDFSWEGAWLNFRQYDTLRNREAIVDRATSYAWYNSIGFSLFDFYVTTEYKNYFYAKPDSLIYKNGMVIRNETNPGYSKVKDFVEPPAARYKHKWFLLTKQAKAPLADDVIGYQGAVTWSHFQPTTITIAANIGGPHKKRDADPLSFDYTCFKFRKLHRYWEGYLEWEQNYNDRVKSKIGIDAGRSDTAISLKDRYAMAGAVLALGPFAQRHSVENSAEFMRGAYYIPVNSGKQKRTSTHYLFSMAYSFSPYITFGYKFEHETRQPFSKDVDDNRLYLPQTFHDYNSFSLTVTPVQNHIFKIEYGSFSEGRKCSMGTCTTIPSFEGLRITATSTF